MHICERCGGDNGKCDRGDGCAVKTGNSDEWNRSPFDAHLRFSVGNNYSPDSEYHPDYREDVGVATIPILEIPPIASLTVPEILEHGAKLFRERDSEYGNSYQQIGKIMSLMFPKGTQCFTPADYSRVDIMFQCVRKLVRYANNMGKGGHLDSAIDLMVYAAMLRESTK